LIWIYNAFLVLYSAGIRLAALANGKARRWVTGRRGLWELLESTCHPGPSGNVWMHCASLGEYEQGRPVLKKLLESRPDLQVTITFFSPSGYDVVRTDPLFKNVYYLPPDSAANASRLLDILRPDLVCWVKYEYWYYYLREIRRRNIPLIMISGVYRPDQVFFRWYGSFYRKMLESFTHFFLQNPSSGIELAKLVPPEKITVTGDTRCDRVISIAGSFTEIPPVQAFCGTDPVIVAGSTWEADEAEWTHFVKNHPAVKFIIAPHEIDEENLGEVQKEFPGSIRYSEWLTTWNAERDAAPPVHCLIIDNIGMLSRLYHYATLTYVGGGFGYNGLHNILEAAVYGKPVIFGPEYDRNFEAAELVDCGGGISIENALELERVVNRLLEHPSETADRGRSAREYVYRNAGASDRILAYLQANRLLTS